MKILVSPSVNYIGQIGAFYRLHASSAGVHQIATFLIMKQTMISHAECLLRFIKCLGCRTLSAYVFIFATQLRKSFS